MDRTKNGPTPKQPKRTEVTGDPWWITVGHRTLVTTAKAATTPRALRKKRYKKTALDKVLLRRAEDRRAIRSVR